MKTNNNILKFLLVLLFSFSFFLQLKSQQMAYKPINPALGGEYFNYSWLLSSANAQNQFDDNKTTGFKAQTAIGGFQENLNRQILSQISKNLFGGEFGEATLTPGVYTMGSLNISISDYFGGLNISIVDIKTGEQTNINLPNTN
ncbi:curli assembly protein CsgF [Soonwooa buanensis]|nr:curli assembly protein CsgF [Soonwooa buanensis]